MDIETEILKSLIIKMKKKNSVRNEHTQARERHRQVKEELLLFIEKINK